MTQVYAPRIRTESQRPDAAESRPLGTRMPAFPCPYPTEPADAADDARWLDITAGQEPTAGSGFADPTPDDYEQLPDCDMWDEAYFGRRTDADLSASPSDWARLAEREHAADEAAAAAAVKLADAKAAAWDALPDHPADADWRRFGERVNAGRSDAERAARRAEVLAALQRGYDPQAEWDAAAGRIACRCPGVGLTLTRQQSHNYTADGHGARGRDHWGVIAIARDGSWSHFAGGPTLAAVEEAVISAFANRDEDGGKGRAA